MTHPIDTPEALAVRVALLEERNHRVEKNKAWEISWFRKFLIMLITYIFATIFLMVIGANNAIWGALVPTFGFFLSTLSMPIIKNIWVKKCLKS